MCLLCLCASVYMCLAVTCWERADLLALVCGVQLWICHFPIGLLGPVWYLIVSISDLCTFTYFGLFISVSASDPKGTRYVVPAIVYMGWFIYFSVSVWSKGNLAYCSDDCIWVDLFISVSASDPKGTWHIVPMIVYWLIYLFQYQRLIQRELGILFWRLYIKVGLFISVSGSDPKRTWYVVQTIVYMGWFIYFSVSIWPESNLVYCSDDCIYVLIYLFQYQHLTRIELGILFRRLYIWVDLFISVSASDPKRTWYVVKTIVYMGWFIYFSVSIWPESNFVYCSDDCIYGLIYLFQCQHLIRSELGMLFRRLYTLLLLHYYYLLSS